jgi:hypothetical protein
MAEEEIDIEPADRGYWERRFNPASLKVAESYMEILKDKSKQAETS